MERIIDSLYELDIDGRIWSIKSQQWLTPSINTNGFNYVTIYKYDGSQRSIMIHTEMWRVFKGSVPIGGIEHIDGNKNNNALSNLRVKTDGNKYVELIKQGITITKIAAFYKTNKKEISTYVSGIIPGGIRSLRKQYPLNKGRDIL